MPLLQSIPCFGLALYAAIRLSRMHRAHQQLWDEAVDNENIVPFNDHPLQFHSYPHHVTPPNHSRSRSSSNSYRLTSMSQSQHPSATNSGSPRQYHLPLKSQLEVPTSLSVPPSPNKRSHDSHSPQFPEFVHPKSTEAKSPTSATPFASFAEAGTSEDGISGEMGDSPAKPKDGSLDLPHRPPGLFVETSLQQDDGGNTEEGTGPKSGVEPGTPIPPTPLSTSLSPSTACCRSECFRLQRVGP